jgi:tetratricopeptide (TPR) repeat protein
MPYRKALLITSTLILLSFFSLSQSFEKRFKELSARNDTIGQIKLLKEWELMNPKDPELFIAYLNYYARQSTTELISLDKNKRDENSIALSDTGTGKPVGYLNSSTKYNSQILQKGFDQINHGIALYPTRLDMRFGKIYMLGQAENFSEFTREIIKTIDYGDKIKDAWVWKQGKPLEAARQFFLSSMQDYINTIYNVEDNDLIPYMRQISEEVLKYNPEHVESLSSVALTYLIIGEYDKALPYLLKAETFAPKDIVVLNNLAEAYKRKNDLANARIYYEKIIKYGNREEVQDAKKKIKNLK